MAQFSMVCGSLINKTFPFILFKMILWILWESFQETFLQFQVSDGSESISLFLRRCHCPSSVHFTLPGDTLGNSIISGDDIYWCWPASCRDVSPQIALLNNRVPNNWFIFHSKRPANCSSSASNAFHWHQPLKRTHHSPLYRLFQLINETS